MPGNIGLPEVVIVLALALLIFGPSHLPELGRSLGRGIRELRGSLGGDDDTQSPPPDSSCTGAHLDTKKGET